MRNLTIGDLCPVRILLLLMIAALSLVATSPTLAANACSASVGLATLNEYNYLDNFTEVRKLDSSLVMTGWKVTVYTSTRTTTGNLPATGTNSCFGGLYQVNQFASNEISQNADIVLFDNNNDVVDIVRVRTSLPVTTTFYPAAVPACAYVSPPYDLLVSSSNKGVDRLPDGDGSWRNTPGTGSNSFQSRCGPNIAGGAADLAISKSASPATVVQGSGLTFTVVVQNTVSGSGAATGVLVDDLLPAGFSYVSHTASVGTYTSGTGLWSVGNLAFGASATLTINATATVVGTITNTAKVASSTFDTNTGNNTAAVSVIVTSPGATLDAVEVGAAAGTAIRTKVAGSAFSLDLLALTSGGAINTTYNRTVTISLVDASSSGTCSAMTLLQAVGSYTFTGSGGGKDNGRKTFAFNYPNAASNVRVRLTDNGSPSITSCSTNNFAIRPAAFAAFAVRDANSVSAGTTRSLTNTAAAGGVVHKAGQPFRIDATAVNASSVATSAYNGSPGASLTACVLPAALCTLGTLSTGAWSAAAGTVTSTTATYSEAGAFTLKLVDTTFAAVDAADSSTAERYFESAALNVGRFVPDHFSIATANTPVLKTFNDSTCAARSFTYIGQPFGYVTTPQALITAQNASGGTTSNYNGALWRPTATHVYASVSGTLDTSLTTAPVVVSNNNGTGSATVAGSDVLAYTRNLTTPQAIFNANLTLTLSASDTSESAVVGNGVISAATSALFDGSGSGIAFDSGNAFRYGRLRLANAHGSELLALPVPMTTQYWNGTTFVLNAADNCTTIVAADIGLGNYQKNLAAGETTVSISGRFSGGNSNLKLTQPGAGNNGSVDLTVDLSAAGADQSYLQGKWLGVNFDQNPTARASFGVYKNADELIYMREVY
jgi:MSHA biogenesis protein MshQ